MRLNLGAGDWRPEGWVTVDLANADINHDLSVYPWPFPDKSAEAILASHVLEHFSRADGMWFLAECWRILRPGARLQLAVPDLDLFVACHLSGDFAPLAGYQWRSLDTLMGGDASEPREEQRHRSMWCEASLSWCLMRTGFRYVRRTEHIEGLHNPTYRAISLYMEASA